MRDFSEYIADKATGVAEQAAAAGTFGVGGLTLNNRNGNILFSMPNRVLEGGRVADPTAHVERQSVSRYFSLRAAGAQLPAPQDLTIVSSLDPCMMCGGSILAAGFNVVSINFDDIVSVNFDKSGAFKTLPAEFARQAGQTFGYFGVRGEYGSQGHIPALLDNPEISPLIRNRGRRAFEESFQTIRAATNTSDEIAVTASADAEKLPPGLGEALLDAGAAAKQRGARANAAALIAPDNTILMVRGGDENLSPIRTPFMALTQDYARQRYRNPGTLPHPKHCRVVLLKGPGRTAADIADMGAFGSTMEGPMPGDFPHLQYVLPSQGARSLNAMMDHFPPLYREIIKVRPVQVKDKRLVAKAQSASL
jgi:tRNA(Arg) A34 adenosine deaminase TadA